jgi:hypothetical protein
MVILQNPRGAQEVGWGGAGGHRPLALPIISVVILPLQVSMVILQSTMKPPTPFMCLGASASTWNWQPHPQNSTPCTVLTVPGACWPLLRGQRSGKVGQTNGYVGQSKFPPSPSAARPGSLLGSCSLPFQSLALNSDIPRFPLFPSLIWRKESLGRRSEAWVLSQLCPDSVWPWKFPASSWVLHL